MYLDPNNSDALLAVSFDPIIVYFKLTKTQQGLFKVVELMNDYFSIVKKEQLELKNQLLQLEGKVFTEYESIK
jgi:hypothetical protein